MMLKRVSFLSASSLIQKNNYHFSLFKDRLHKMFDDQQFVMRLSSMTRIYPQYFSDMNVKQFTHEENFHHYTRYVSQEKHQNNNRKYPASDITEINFPQHKTVDELFESFPVYKKSLPYLNCYLDWLQTRKLQKNSNQYFKNKCVMQMFDMRNPQNWFINNTSRHFIYHHGPTNSGKTSAAIKQLKQLPKDNKGIYMAPLRLLAWQMQQKLQNCNLITGQDKEFRVSNLTSCTIQALNTNEQYDVAIIDEIQMIGDEERGWSWTKAILSTKAKRIHLCGDERAIGLVSKLVKDCGGTLEQRRYSRLGKLKLLPKIFEMKNIEEGDCMIEFSVDTLHKLRRKIREEIDRKERQKEMDAVEQAKYNKNIRKSSYNDEEEGKQLVSKEEDNTQKPTCSPIAMVYGRLPPQCRKQQAHKFNQKIAPYLVATNAIGMGLNLNIKKIIFAGIKRRNSKGQEVQLQEHEIQQIAGRAGRGSKDGLVQCISYDILKKVRKALRNVNKTYGINLQDEQAQDEMAKNYPEEQDASTQQTKKSQKQVSSSQLQNYDQFLHRTLTQKQRSIQKAGLFIEYLFLKRMKNFLQEHYSRNISLTQVTKLYLNLSLQSSDMYFLSQKRDLLQWVEKIQKQFRFQSRDVFQIAKCLSMHYNSFYAKEKMMHFATQFSKKRKVHIPTQSILQRNQKKSNSNFNKLDTLQSNYSVVEVYINLWNKYEFIFGDIEEANTMKQLIAEQIKQVLQNQDGFVFRKKASQTDNEDAQDSKIVALDQQASDIQHIRLGQEPININSR